MRKPPISPTVRKAIGWKWLLFTNFWEGRIHTLPAVEFLSRLPSDFVGCLILDPPGDMGILTYDDQRPYVDEQGKALAVIAKEAYRVLRPGGSVVFLSESRLTHAWEFAAARSNLHSVNELTVLWKYQTDHRAPSNLPSFFSTVQWHVKPGHRIPHEESSIAQSNVLVANPVHHTDRLHAAQRPVELYRYLIDLTSGRGDFVVDPYCGSGSSLIAAELEGRHWLGGDIDPDAQSLLSSRLKDIHVDESNLYNLYWWVNGQEIKIGDVNGTQDQHAAVTVVTAGK